MKIKILGVEYGYDYPTDTELRTFSEETPWLECEEVWFERLKTAIKYKHLLPKNHPLRQKGLIVLEDLTEEVVDMYTFICEVEEAAKKELQLQALRKKRAEQKKLQAEEKALEMKRKKFAQLKLELEG